jgi:2-polyprenyl-3-methyl-5-hydroxy-6-metoxy-1,4-benzoquinol methylase
VACIRLAQASDQPFSGLMDDLRSLGRFDIVHCLGLLYHLENPLAALKNLHRVCDGVLLLETIIVDSKLPMLLLADVALRLVQPWVELRIGVLTALIGAPFFVWLVLRTRAELAP